CHSIHESDPDQHLTARMRSNEACLQCHEGFREKLSSHTHHLANSSGSECYNCHMPHTSWGLLKAIRTHQITSPDVRTSVKTGRPNACNLCHLDRSFAWTAGKLSEWYQMPVPTLDAEHRSVSAAVLARWRGW